jgi:hypothetical protein
MELSASSPTLVSHRPLPALSLTLAAVQVRLIQNICPKGLLVGCFKMGLPSLLPGSPQPLCSSVWSALLSHKIYLPKTRLDQATAPLRTLP